MDAANRLLREIHQRLFAGRRDHWLSGLLLALTSAAGTAVAVETLHEFRSCLSLLLFAAVATGAVAGWLWMVLRRLNARMVDRQTLVQTQRAVAGCRFAEGNLILAAGLLAFVTGLLFVCGTSWPVLAMLAGAVASACVLVLGSLPGAPLNALVLCAGPVLRRSHSFEHWPGELLLFERQRRARLADSASDRPRLEEFRDALDAERAGLAPRDLRPPAAGTLAEELPGRLRALLWPAGIATIVAAVSLLLLSPADGSLAGHPPESPARPPESPPADSSPNPPASSQEQTNSLNDSDSQASNLGGDTGARPRNGDGRGGDGRGGGSSQQEGANGGGAKSRPGPGSGSARRSNGRSPHQRNGNGTLTQVDNESKPGGSPNGDAKKKKGPTSTTSPPGQARNSRTRKQNGSENPGGGGAGTSGGAREKLNTKPGPRRNASPAPIPPGQGPITHIRISGGTRVDGQPLDLPQGAGTGKASDADTVRRSSVPEPARLPSDSRPVQIPAFPLRKR